MTSQWHEQAADLHDLAAQAHRTAAVHRDKGDHQSAHERSRQALDHAAKAFEHSQNAMREAAEKVK